MAGAVFLQTSRELGHVSQTILQDNYRSVLAAERMKEALERIDSAAVFIGLGERAKGLAQAQENRPRFESELQVQENNITEVGTRTEAHRGRSAPEVD